MRLTIRKAAMSMKAARLNSGIEGRSANPSLGAYCGERSAANLAVLRRVAGELARCPGADVIGCLCLVRVMLHWAELIMDLFPIRNLLTDTGSGLPLAVNSALLK